MANKPFNTYYDERVELSGAAPPSGDFYLVEREGVVYKSTFGGTFGMAGSADDSDVTTIATVDTWTVIANVMALESSTPTLVFAANQFTYSGVNQTVATPIRASSSMIKNVAGDMVYKIGILINGSPVNLSSAVTVSDTAESFVATTWHAALNPGDTIEMAIKNISGDNDIILTNPQLSIG